MEEKDLVAIYLNDIKKYKILSKEEEEELLLKIKKGDLEAKNQLIVSNLRLVVSIAKNYMNKKMSFIDLISEGNFGLIHAVEKFDMNKGYRFSTYAVWWIKQSITKALINKGREIRIPSYKYDIYNKINKFVLEEVSKTGEYPTNEEIAQKLDLKLKTVEEANIDFQEIMSLNEEIGDNIYLEDTLAIQDDIDIEKEFINKMGREKVKKMVNDLNIREREILKRRYGLDGYDIHTLEEIGETFSITRERVRQLEKKTLAKLRKKYNKETYKNLFI
ncbi:sigma-70 family RNA polymerase sigma factor [Fusobacterium perfoetens]|uniref:sigma-70 family RNA polymerase sigma factor n=1 Tax=Fusobacterium perfoetens TaxID=852 RepID=UPI0004816554|nr:sigma-70 family RNA polymerase sigma factor [Fusobacterium perfoetens]MCI6152391.1 sigma-70 family RNA polymerase sigma factor [Fusobacterium perfoetens]MDY3236990.1 sigma-70 family RNA polymerase sigma factor [Fusobacterium perfoetens]